MELGFREVDEPVKASLIRLKLERDVRASKERGALEV
jgi:hypothetical protein